MPIAKKLTGHSQIWKYKKILLGVKNSTCKIRSINNKKKIISDLKNMEFLQNLGCSHHIWFCSERVDFNTIKTFFLYFLIFFYFVTCVFCFQFINKDLVYAWCKLSIFNFKQIIVISKFCSKLKTYKFIVFIIWIS